MQNIHPKKYIFYGTSGIPNFFHESLGICMGGWCLCYVVHPLQCSTISGLHSPCAKREINAETNITGLFYQNLTISQKFGFSPSKWSIFSSNRFFWKRTKLTKNFQSFLSVHSDVKYRVFISTQCTFSHTNSSTIGKNLNIHNLAQL